MKPLGIILNLLQRHPSFGFPVLGVSFRGHGRREVGRGTHGPADQQNVAGPNGISQATTQQGAENRQGSQGREELTYLCGRGIKDLLADRGKQTDLAGGAGIEGHGDRGQSLVTMVVRCENMWLYIYIY